MHEAHIGEQDCSPDSLREAGYYPLSEYTKKYNIPQSTLASAAARGVLTAVRQSGHKLRPYWARPVDVVIWLRKYRPFVLQKQDKTNDEPATLDVVDAKLPVALDQVDTTHLVEESGFYQAPPDNRLPCFKILPGADLDALPNEDDDLIDVAPDVATDNGIDGSIPLEWPDEFEEFAGEELGEGECIEDERTAEDLPPEPEPSTFRFFDGSVCEGILYDGLPYVELEALCGILDLKHPRDVARRLRREGYEVLTFIAPVVSNHGGEALRKKNYVGLDSAMIVAGSSRKRAARDATKWLFQTVFMSIVRKGHYAAPGVEALPDLRLFEAKIQEGSIAKRLAEANRERLILLSKQQAETQGRLADLELANIRSGSRLDHTLGMATQIADEVETTRAAQSSLEKEQARLRAETAELEERIAREQARLEEKTTNLESKFGEIQKADAIRQWESTVTMTSETHKEWLRVFNTIVRGYARGVIEQNSEWQRLNRMRVEYDHYNAEYRRITARMNEIAKAHYRAAYNGFYRQLKALGGIDVFARQRAVERRRGRRPHKNSTIDSEDRRTVMRVLLVRLGHLGVAPKWLRDMPIWKAFWALEELNAGVPFSTVQRKYATYH